MLSARTGQLACKKLVSVASRRRRTVQVYSEMAPKRAAEPKDGSSKKGKTEKPKTEAPSFNPKWKSIKPSLLLFGDDEPGCEKVAAFDLDGTLVEWKQGRTFSLEPGSWIWFNEKVPGKLKEVHEYGFKIVIFTNQALIKSALGGKAAAQLRAKIDEILAEADVPATVYAATMSDTNRKPGLGMWTHFIQHSNDGKVVDKKSSYYVGDAAGRPDDHSDSDKAFAEAAGLPFKIPEDFFGEGCLPNKGMAHCLSKLEKEVRASGEANAGFKANAFRKAAAVIGTHPEKLTSAKDAGKLSGVGKGMMSLIQEYLETGKMGAEHDKEKGKGDENEDKAKEKENGAKNSTQAKPSAGIAFL